MYSKNDYLKALIIKVCGCYIVKKTESVDRWEPVEHSEFYLELHKKSKRENPYIVLRSKSKSIFVSSLFTLVTEVGAINVFDIKVDGQKNYFSLKNDSLENENIIISRKE